MDWRSFKSQINFGLTSYCNALCSMCERTIQIDNLKVTHNSLEKIKHNIEHNVPDPITKISLAGDFGDPLMHPDISEIIDFIKQKNFDIVIHTNGGLRNASWFKQIGEKHPDVEIVFGIDGTSQEINDKYRKNVDFDLAFSNMLEYQKYVQKDKCVWQYIIFPWNLHQIQQAKKICEGKNIYLYFIANDRGSAHDRISVQMYKRLSQSLTIDLKGSVYI